MPRTPSQLRADALAIWHAGLEAVHSDRLVREHVRVDGEWLTIGQRSWHLSVIDRIAVVGAGKAGAGMVAGLHAALGRSVLTEKRVVGWVNVPANCVRRLSHINLFAARPAGVNEPTEEGIEGTNRILEIVDSLGPQDLCICLLSGGASALLPAPVFGVSLADKQHVTRTLSAAGANIQELNTVRKQLSRIKGGGLARACRAGHLVSLIISDVLGDPLDVIASGPTVPNSTTAADAWEILHRLIGPGAIPTPVLTHLRITTARDQPVWFPAHRVTNLVIGNNALAVDAAGLTCRETRSFRTPE